MVVRMTFSLGKWGWPDREIAAKTDAARSPELGHDSQRTRVNQRQIEFAMQIGSRDSEAICEMQFSGTAGADLACAIELLLNCHNYGNSRIRRLRKSIGSVWFCRPTRPLVR